ncbi:drug/metabolite transporter (DMT)-like permease [Rhizobium leucaenae]|uniref:Drug/metabolite transporter (DMT)-like permease n=1 Tax=Rhizobium leucaenae TaxID=29450 RepID=A0A7W7ELG8_9HYPH|nr:drug/metabolite transporter (DMT)-like permease [Rhizobium leucaenae]
MSQISVVSAHQNPLQGMAIMASAMIVLPVMDAIAKYMATFEAMSPGQVTFYRFFFQLVCTLPPLFAVFGWAALSAKRPWMNLLRGALHGAASLLFFVAVKYMPLADVFAIYFVEPFILTALSALFLGDKVGWRRWLAIVVGFGGAMIVIQPSFAIFGWKALLPVACAFLYALYLFLNRAVGEADSPLTMQTMAGIGGTIFMAAALWVGASAGVADFTPSLPASWLGLALLADSRLHLRLRAYVDRPRVPAGTAVAAGALSIFRDHLGNHSGLCAVRRFSECFQVDRHPDHRRIGPLHHLAGACSVAIDEIGLNTLIFRMDRQRNLWLKR